MSRTEDTHRQRRQYADMIAHRNDMQHEVDKQNGTLEPRSAKVKRGFISFLVGYFAADLLRGGD